MSLLSGGSCVCGGGSMAVADSGGSSSLFSI